MRTADDLWAAAESASDGRDFARAELLYRRALKARKDHVPALIGLSTVLSRRGVHREARDAALAAFERRPAEAPLIYAVAQRLRYFHEFRRLVECLSAPGLLRAPAEVLAKAAVMLSSIGAHAEATRLADAALQRDPANAGALYVRGNFHMFDGNPDQAEPFHEAALRADPTLAQASLMLANARAQTDQRNHVERLRGQLRRARPGGSGEVYAGFALHKELHDLGRHDEAWEALSRACQARRRQLAYDARDPEALVEALSAVCSPGFLATRSAVEQPATPLFIVGMHRSGTTLLERMLAGHSRIGDAGETSSVHAQLELAIDRPAPPGMDADFARQVVASADFDAVARGYADAARWLSRGNAYFTEKLPQNFFNVGFIARAIPQARFLHMVRDPTDTCFSNLRTLFSGAALYSYDQVELGRFFLAYRRMMAHWAQVLPGAVLDVSYDELVSDPEAMARRIAAHCGFGFEPAMVDIGRASGTVSTPSANVARAGFRKDRGRVWEPYRARLQPLRDTLAAAYAADGPAPP